MITKVSVSVDALNNSKRALEEMANVVALATMNCESECGGVSPYVDKQLQADVTQFLSTINDFMRKIREYFNENSRAIDERITRLNEYLTSGLK
ncbi:MAG: hypothetical protein FWD49_05445 [Firmicutes bacterium]|nr:hypothetical protein [Bacillota bacterium]